MISREQVRAARAWLNIGQHDVAEGVGVSSQTISDIENERTNPKASVLADIQSFFEMKGVEFLEDGGIKKSKNFVKVYEGNDCYLKLLDDVHEVLAKGGELLKSAADERRSSKKVIEKTREMRKDGIKMRGLVKSGDTYLMGKLDEYRWMEESLFTDGDVKLIYANRVAYLITWLETPKTIIIQDKTIAEEAKRHFEYVWQRSEKPPETTATAFYEESMNDKS
jgi:DNA-binding XRE family transcriptional regulator